jgi:hypothetical protein
MGSIISDITFVKKIFKNLQRNINSYLEIFWIKRSQTFTKHDNIQNTYNLTSNAIYFIYACMYYRKSVSSNVVWYSDLFHHYAVITL